MKYLREVFVLSWTLAGSAYILITLPPGTQVFRLALTVTFVAFLMHMISLALSPDDDDE